MPVITLEVMSDSSNTDPIITDYVTETPTNIDTLPKDESAGIHFLTEPKEEFNPNDENGRDEPTPKGRSDLLEYMTRNDGSVICKLCGEILLTRTHWYRHKYKHHVTQSTNSTPLFQCEQCFVYFKSRKGYIGHLASRHSDMLSDASPVLCNSQIEAFSKEKIEATPEIKEESDPELVIPKSSVPNYQTTIIKHASKSTETKKPCRAKEQIPQVKPADWEAQRSREDKLVADIIDRVRRECEAQQGIGGGAGPARRGYTRRTTVMNT